MSQGTEQYPKKGENNCYYIAGGENSFFKATHIEFYGVNLQ